MWRDTNSAVPTLAELRKSSSWVWVYCTVLSQVRQRWDFAASNVPHSPTINYANPGS